MQLQCEDKGLTHSSTEDGDSLQNNPHSIRIESLQGNDSNCEVLSPSEGQSAVVAAMGIDPSPRPQGQLPTGGKAPRRFDLPYNNSGEYCGNAEEQGETHPEGAAPAEDLQMAIVDTSVKIRGVGEKNSLVIKVGRGYTLFTRPDGEFLDRGQMFTDYNSCMMDTFNALVGDRIATRESCDVPHLAVPWSKMRPVMQNAGFEVCRVYSNSRGAVPQMEALMCQSGKLFIVEYVWNKSNKGETPEWDYHVVGVDTQVRAVFCNTVGILPFLWKNKRAETESTHRKVVEQLRVHRVLKVWCLCRKVTAPHTSSLCRHGS